MKSIWIFIFSIVFLRSLSAQVHDHNHDHDHHHDHEHHHEQVEEKSSRVHKYHLGIANAPTYFLDDMDNDFGVHIHIVRMFAESKLGIGLAYERILNDRKLNSFGVVGSYRVTNEWVISASPRLSLKNEEAMDFAFHLKTAYEFQIHNFHLGPVFQFAYDPADTRISFGLRLGYSWD